MPYVKFISGHSETVKKIQKYLEKNNRHLAEDFINAARESMDGLSWAEVMDETREEYGTQHARKGQRARRYEHIIISLDPQDDVSLDDFRDYVTSIASRWFDDEIGRFQVAIVYHDDNNERVSRGEKGVLHAHLVINNADLESGLRISPKLTPRTVTAFALDVNNRALDLGWHGFANNGVSLTLEEMRARGLEPSKGRRAARLMAQGIEAPGIEGEEEYSFTGDKEADITGSEDGYNPAPNDGQAVVDATVDESSFGRTSHDGITENTYSGKGSAGRKDDMQGSDETFRVKFEFKSGGVRVFDFTRQPAREDMAERRYREREGFSWKQDIRDRVDVAMRLAESTRDFTEICDLLGVGISYNKQGDIKFSHPSAPDTRVVKGQTLGNRYSAGNIATILSMKGTARQQRAHDLPGRERYMRDPERRAAMLAAAEAEPDTVEGASDMSVIRDFIAYNDAHGIKSYEDYPDTRAGRAARSYAELIGAFDAEGDKTLDESTPLIDRLELQRFIREETGAGGLGITVESPRTGGTIDEAPSAGGEQPRKKR